MMLVRGNRNVVEAGMTFNVAVGLHGLQNPEARDIQMQSYSMMVADTGRRPWTRGCDCVKWFERLGDGVRVRVAHP